MQIRNTKKEPNLSAGADKLQTLKYEKISDLKFQIRTFSSFSGCPSYLASNIDLKSCKPIFLL